RRLAVVVLGDGGIVAALAQGQVVLEPPQRRVVAPDFLPARLHLLSQAVLHLDEALVRLLLAVQQVAAELARGLLEVLSGGDVRGQLGAVLQRALYQRHALLRFLDGRLQRRAGLIGLARCRPAGAA